MDKFITEAENTSRNTWIKAGLVFKTELKGTVRLGLVHDN
jgi:hypothetical protein